MRRRKSELLHRVSHALALPYFSIVHRVRCLGTENIPKEGPAIVAANHQSYYDPLLIMLAAARPIVFIAWDRLFRCPLVGRLMRAYGVVPVNVDAPGPAAYAALIRTLRSGRLCGIFPEGGRTPDGRLQRPEPGVGALALETAAPVVPVTICGAHRAWPVGRFLPRPGRIQIAVGEPMTFRPGPDGASHRRRAEVAHAVMQKIADGFAILDPAPCEGSAGACL